MGTEILKSFGTLQSELEQAKDSLKGVDENIKRLIGRDPSEIIPRAGTKRTIQNDDIRNKRGLLPGIRKPNHENDEPTNKRRNISVFSRLSERSVIHYEEEEQKLQKQIISKVIVTPKEIPSRQEALAAQSCDEKSKARNRRMFGALLGTLQKFQQEETKLKFREEKRAQLEKKIEEHEIKEKAEIRKERQELFFNRKKKQAEIKMIELKMKRMKEYAVWEERQKPRMNFIQTKAKPYIHYLPRKMNDNSKKALEECKHNIEAIIDKKRQEVFDELQHIEERMKKNFDSRRIKEHKLEETNGDVASNKDGGTVMHTNVVEAVNQTHDKTSKFSVEKEENFENCVTDSQIEKSSQEPENSTEDNINKIEDGIRILDVDIKNGNVFDSASEVNIKSECKS